MNPSMATPLSSALRLCKRIKEEYSHISEGHLDRKLAINRKQCMLLSNKVSETEETLEAIQVRLSQQDTTSSGFPNGGPITQELVHVLRAAHTTIFKDCFCNGRWMESALRQGGDLKETFAEILYDLQWYMMVLRSIFLKWIFQDRRTPPSWLLQQVDCDRNLSERDNDSLLKAAKQDQEDLKVRLGKLKGDHACHGERCTGMGINQQCLASQLLNKIEFEEQFQAWPTEQKKNYHKELCQVNGIRLIEWPFVVLANLQDLVKGALLGEGSFGRVQEAKWRGESYAMKVPKYRSTEALKPEIAVVAGVHHPHILGLVFCAEDANNSVYVMERMDKSLSRMLTEQSSDSQLSLIGRVSVMLQIAEGMKHLHSKGLVHRDLKTDNILIKCDGPGSESSMLDLGVKPLWIAKITDFGTTKVKMESTAYANQTTNVGTTMFMAPELYAVEHVDQQPERFHPKKTDVYSFGLICFAVLTGEPTPFPTDDLQNPSVKSFKDRVREGKRPQLPPDCPSLSNLIQQCWDGNPDKRPNFQEICTKLRHIKGLLLTGASGISQTGGRSEAAAAGAAGGENRGPRDGQWFRISDSCSLALHRGDITKWFVDGKTDAIVNAAKEAMSGGSGVDGAIHRAAGPELLKACNAVPEVTRGVRCLPGSAVITGGFNLPASKVIHTVRPRYSSDEVSAAPLAKAYRSSVDKATEAGVKYIAFPAISCGAYGYPHKKAAKIAIQTLKESSGGLLEVHFVLFDESTWNAWLAEAKASLEKA